MACRGLSEHCHDVGWEQQDADDLRDPRWLIHNGQMVSPQITPPQLIESAQRNLSTIYCSFHCYEIKSCQIVIWHPNVLSLGDDLSGAFPPLKPSPTTEA